MAKSRRKQDRRQATGGTNPSAAAPAQGTAPPVAVPRPTQDSRAQERIRQQQERAAARQRQQRQRQIRTALLSLAVVLVVGAGAIWGVTALTAPAPGRTVPIVQPSDHVADGEKVTTYNTVPPTSGPHYGATAAAGVHTEPVSDELQVHNLEHGQIMIQYTCTDCPELAEQLKVFAERYPKWVIIAPYPNPDVGARIALTAWGAIDTFDQFDEQRITKFVEYYKNKGPEKVIRD